MSDNIKVVVKVRPLISREIEDKLSYQWRVKNNTLHQIDQNGKDLGTSFTFDKVYDQDTDISEVFDDVAKPIVEAAIAGFNGTIFAYGQTSSGKTYTMSGTEESPGIIPKAVIHLFDRIKQIPDRDFLVRVSYIEIYNETLRDLLNVTKKNLKVHESHQGVKVDVDERVTSSPEEVLEAMREGEANRQTGATNMNEESSRSHSIFQITIASREHMEDEEEVCCVNVSQLNLVDLAGSERSGQTGATGIRFKEGTHINKSLSVLARVIKQLSDSGLNSSNKYINYRDSKLTRILQNSLGGNAKTSIICAITPASVEETISTLQFANRAKAIQNKPEVNAVATNATANTAMIQSLTKQMSKLQAQLADKRNLEQDNANLLNTISNLQKWIANGLVQNSSMDSTLQSRRKMQQLRRVTISTLHPITEAEDTVPAVPKFCTPSLKYNPLSISTSSEFLPIQNSSSMMSLGPLPEETERMITPPLPGGTKVEDDNIINLDDSDDIPTEKKTCSPYHKCYAQSKTPPCVLRNNALAAEKNLQEIIDLTKREKIYSPNTAELLEKVEQKCMEITKLEEEVTILKEQSKEKDSEINELRNKIVKTEQEVDTITNTKISLENQCKDFTAKLIDWEVSYETLQNKSRRREEELLSLLDEEKSSKKPEDIHKSMSRELNFMDISKDISLVNSDTENSINTNPLELESSEQIKELVMELQAQLNAKNDAIFKLESSLYAEKQKVESLEGSIIAFQSVIDDFNSKYPRLETENSFLQSTIETLNSTIEKQKSCLEATNHDIQSYNSTIQELQIKLSRKETLPHIKLNDNLLETMIINEEKLIANNENIRNIIKSFKLVLDSRNKEIDILKSQIKVDSETKLSIDTIKDEIEIKEKHIHTLMEQLEKVKDQLNDNVDIINKLMTNEKELSTKLVDARDQNDSCRKQMQESSQQTSILLEENAVLTNIVHELNTKLDDAQSQLQKQSEENLVQLRGLDEINMKRTSVINKLNSELVNSQGEKDLLKKQNDELIAQTNYLQDLNIELTNTIAEKNAVEQEIQTKHNILSQEYDNMSKKINELEREVHLKHEEITTLSNLDKHTQECLVKLKLVLFKVQDVLFLLNNKTMEIPEHVENLETVFCVFNDGMHNLQTAVQQLVEERNQAVENHKTTTQQLFILEDKYKSDLSTSQETIKILTTSKDETVTLNGELLSQITSMESSLIILQNEIETKNRDIVVLESQLNQVRESNENLRNDYRSKENIVLSLREKISALEGEIKLFSLTEETIKNDLNQNVADLTKVMIEKQEYFEGILKNKNEAISNLKSKLVEVEKALECKNQEVATAVLEICEVKQKQKTVLSDVLDKVSKLSCYFNVKIDIPADIESDSFYKIIINALDKVLLCFSTGKHKQGYQNSDVESELAQARKDIEELIEINSHHMHEFAAVGQKSLHILTETESMEAFNENLSETSELLSNLKSELTAKANEILAMEKKTLQWKDQFKDLQSDMQQQIMDLQLENKMLRNREVTKHDEKKSPPSLVTICCGNIIEAMQLNSQVYSVSSKTSKSTIDSLDAEAQVNICKCTDMTLKLNRMIKDNIKLTETIKQLESVNKGLLNEQEEIRREIQLLVEPAQQLQKKVINHRTNLSTLMATTYAENKLLQSQLKVMKHHHTRYINVCQKDLPCFKSQLLELMMILKDNESYVDRHNVSFKRHFMPDALDNYTSLANFKNESTLDSDLLMLDTNVTLASAESTLLNYDQTCLDNTQMNLDDELAETSKAIELYTKNEWLKNYDKKLLETVQNLKIENQKLREQVPTGSLNIKSGTHKVEFQSKSDTSFSTCSDSASNTYSDSKVCKSCSEKLQSAQNDSLSYQEQLSDVINRLELDLGNMKLQKDEIEKKYTELTLEIPTTETLVKKINSLEQENQKKLQQITKMTNDLSKKIEIIKDLQEENGQLSTQVMENISEVDDLKKELDSIKELILKPKEIEEVKIKSKSIETDVKGIICEQCRVKDNLKAIQSNVSPLLKLNRSISDFEDKQICTVQNEILLSKEDCKNVSEDVTAVKNSLERSNFSISMDLDDSMSGKDIFSFAKDIPKETSKMKTTVVEQTSSDLYTVDKMECLQYYIATTGDDKENLVGDFKLIDIMKAFYINIVSKHSQEVENFANRIQDFEDSKFQLITQIDNASVECKKLTKEIEMKDNYMKTVHEVLASIRTNTDLITEQIRNIDDEGNDEKVLTMFKDNLLNVLDKEFNISSSNIFESLISYMASKHKMDLEDIIKRNTEIQAHVVSVEAEVNAVNENLIQLKAQLTEKEHDYALLKAQKDKIQEISNAVTLDIVKKEQKIHRLIKTGYEQLIECNATEIDLTLPVDASLNLLFKKAKDLQTQNISRINYEKETLTVHVDELKDVLEQKELELASLKSTLFEKEKAILTQFTNKENLDKAAQKNFHNIYMPLKEFERTIQKRMEELLQKISEKEQAIILLQSKIKQEHADKKPRSIENLHKIGELIEENESLNSINSMISEEKQLLDTELQKSKELLNKNKVEIDKLTADVLVLRATVADNVSVIESLSLEAKALHEQNELLKKKAEVTSQDSARLEINIKTHEKTAEIQTRMINRLKKQKEDSDEAMKEKDKKLDKLTMQCLELQKVCEEMSEGIKASKEEIEQLKSDKKHLEDRVSQLETEMEDSQRRRSVEVIGDHSRRRRQSLHDSRRLAESDDFPDHNKMEALFESRSKADDLFMDVDCGSGHSNRSTPLRLSRGRDSLVKQDSDDDPPSRPSSVLATKLRRQSIHDSHRNTLGHTTSPHGQPRIVEMECNDNTDSSANITDANQLRQRLTATQKELEELKEKYRELDEECEICAQYLHERDARCAALKKEKRELEQQIAELNARLKVNPNASQGDFKLMFSDKSVNTDEDWANLHAVVVDRMSFDAEVEKNKKLTRTIEELRYKNQDLKKTVQKLMEKLSGTKDSRELEMTKSELNACKEELEELKGRYRELDEECETCAEYLKEREEQCRKLKETKASLEAKLLEYEERDVSNIAQSLKKRRQSMHDQNRSPIADYTDATTETNEDLLSHQVERDNSRHDATQSWETKHKQLSCALDKVIKEKIALEQKLMAFNPTTYVSTGSAIVQSQQLTDVMKENQKLKKINAKLVEMCKKRGKSQDSRCRDNRENEDPAE